MVADKPPTEQFQSKRALRLREALLLCPALPLFVAVWGFLYVSSQIYSRRQKRQQRGREEAVDWMME